MQKWILGIVGALIVAGVTGIIAATFASGKADAATEVRVHYVEARLDTQDERIERIEREFARVRQLLERMDQRSADDHERLERVEQKQDEALKRRQR